MIVVRDLEDSRMKSGWLKPLVSDFRTRFLNLLAYQFRTQPTSLALYIVGNDGADAKRGQLSLDELYMHMSTHDVHRLQSYARNLVDYHLVVDLSQLSHASFLLGNLVDLNCLGYNAPSCSVSVCNT